MGKRLSILLYLGFALLLAVLVFLPTDWESTRTDGSGGQTYDTITILAPLLTYGLLWSAASAAAVLFLLAMLAYKWRVIRYPVVALLLAIFAFPFAALANTFNNFGSWTSHGRVTDDDGSVYVFCDSSFLMGQIMALTRMETENAVFARYRVLGTNNGDSPRSWASVVRPAGPEDKYGQLYLTDERKLVGIRSGNRCYLVYELATDTFLGHGDVEEISPFLCIGEDDELHDLDMETTIATIDEREPDRAGYPRRETLVAAGEHASPRVVAAAATLLASVEADGRASGDK